MSLKIDLPKVENIPELAINVEGLKRHSLLMIFVFEPSLSIADRKLRTWLLHTVATAARHYTKARLLVQTQNVADQSSGNDTIFHTLDVYEEIEGAVMAAHRACMAIRRLGSTRPVARDFEKVYADSLKALCAIRNQYEHMHTQIASNQTGPGPISMTFSHEGRKINFRSLYLDTDELHCLIDRAFNFVAKMYPAFDAASKPELPGPIKLTATCTVTVSERNPPHEG
jgi:hypothetical protein